MQVQEHTAPDDGQESLELQWTALDKQRADLQKQRADLHRQRAGLDQQQADLNKQAAGLAQQVAEHAEQVANLADQVTELDQERREMAAVGIADHDIVDLSVGGTLFTTKRATLTQVEGSLLEAMFRGRWEECLDRTSQGQVFLDFDADAFARILGMLRQLRLCDCTPSDMVVSLTQDPGKQQAFESLVNYLGLREVLGVHSAGQANAQPSQLSTACGTQQHGQTFIDQWISSGQVAQYPATIPQSGNTPTNQAYIPSIYTQHLYQASSGQTTTSQASGLHTYSLP